MDWTKQAEDMLKTWTTSQQSMWDSWLKTIQSVGTTQTNETWEKSIETWKDSVQRALEAQNSWTKFWAESVVASSGSNKQASDWSNQMVEMTKKWTDTQAQLWNSWFETIKKADPSAMSQTWNTEEMQKIVESWQEAAQKAMEAQMEWTRMLTSGQLKQS